MNRTQAYGTAVAGALLTMTACGTLSATPGGGQPPALRIGTSAPVAGEAVGQMALDGVRLVGTLPATPPAAAVYRYREPVEEADVRRLAEALGLTAAPIRHDYGWVVTGPFYQLGGGAQGATLRVGTDGPSSWSYGSDDVACPLGGRSLDVYNPDGDHPSFGCAAPAVVAPSEGPVPGSGSVGAPDPARARELAAPLLASVGLAAAPTTMQLRGDLMVVSVDPVIDGWATHGVQTDILVSSTGIRSAHGVLGAPVKGDAYPLVSARTAYDQLVRQPAPETAQVCSQPVLSGAPTHPTCSGPTIVTGASLGLTSRTDGPSAHESAVLVPAWLFHGMDGLLVGTVVAVAPQFLRATSTDTRGDAGAGGSVGGTVSSVPAPATWAPRPQRPGAFESPGPGAVRPG